MDAQGQAPSDLCLAVNGIPLRRNQNVSTLHPKGGHHRRTRKNYSREERSRKVTSTEAARQRSAPRGAEGEQTGPSSPRRRRPRSRWFALGSSSTTLLGERAIPSKCLWFTSRRWTIDRAIFFVFMRVPFEIDKVIVPLAPSLQRWN